MKSLSFKTKAGQTINEVINSKASSSNLSFRVYCHLQDYKAFKKSVR